MTRREVIAGMAVALGTGASLAAQEKSVVIHDELDFHVSPRRIYEALTDAKQFSAFSGVPGAKIQREPGGAFFLFNDHILGRNVELVPDRRIVQAWRTADWPEGLYSIARFELRAQGSGTRLIFDHTGFPPELRDHLASGWQEHYWGPLRKYFGE